MKAPEVIKTTIDVGNGVPVTIETGRLAKQADGAVIVRAGNCMLMATVVSSIGAREGVDFLPLSVDYQENMPLPVNSQAVSLREKQDHLPQRSWFVV